MNEDKNDLNSFQNDLLNLNGSISVLIDYLRAGDAHSFGLSVCSDNGGYLTNKAIIDENSASSQYPDLIGTGVIQNLVYIAYNNLVMILNPTLAQCTAQISALLTAQVALENIIISVVRPQQSAA